MVNLIRAEMYKLLKSKAFWSCIVVGVIFVILGIISIRMIENSVLDDFSSSIYNTGAYYYTNGFSENSIYLYFAIFIAVFVGGEFANGTIKMMVSRGYSRVQVYLAKLISTVFASLIMMSIINGVSIILSTIYWGWQADNLSPVKTSDFIRFSFVELLIIIAVATMFISLSMIFRSRGGSMAISICIITFGYLFFAILDFIVYKIGVEFKFDFEKIKIMPSDIWIFSVVSRIDNFNLSGKDFNLGLVVAIVYILIFTFLGMISFNKKDIK